MNYGMWKIIPNKTLQTGIVPLTNSLGFQHMIKVIHPKIKQNETKDWCLLIVEGSREQEIIMTLYCNGAY